MGLFVIKKRANEQYWTNSKEHGCGWAPNEPKQAWSKSELVLEIADMLQRGFFANCEIIKVDVMPSFCDADHGPSLQETPCEGKMETTDVCPNEQTGVYAATFDNAIESMLARFPSHNSEEAWRFADAARLLTDAKKTYFETK